MQHVREKNDELFFYNSEITKMLTHIYNKKILAYTGGDCSSNFITKAHPLN